MVFAWAVSASPAAPTCDAQKGGCAATLKFSSVDFDLLGEIDYNLIWH
jgi:hypothetical protein